METWHFIVSGRVQGVWFRRSVLEFVNKTVPEVIGFVKNLRDGNVEILARGTGDNLEKLEIYCRQGPGLSVVNDVEIDKNVGAAKIDGPFKVS